MEKTALFITDFFESYGVQSPAASAQALEHLRKVYFCSHSSNQQPSDCYVRIDTLIANLANLLICTFTPVGAQILGGNFRQDTEGMNVAIRCRNGHWVNAHRNILKQYPYFDNSLKWNYNYATGPTHKGKQIVELSQFPAHCVESLLDYLYVTLSAMTIPMSTPKQVEECLWLFWIADYCLIDSIKELAYQALDTYIIEKPTGADILISLYQERLSFSNYPSSEQDEKAYADNSLPFPPKLILRLFNAIGYKKLSEAQLEGLHKVFSAASKQGDFFASVGLADLSFYPNSHVVRDHKKAKEMYDEVVGRDRWGLVECRLAQYYAECNDGKESAKHLKRAAEKGDAFAQSQLAAWYYFGNSEVEIKVNYEKAIEYMQKAAQQNYASAYGLLGYLFEEGKAIPKDAVLALWHLHKSVKLGFTGTFYYLGLKYAQGIEGVLEKNPQRAFAFFHEGAKRGHDGAMVETACCYGKGVGVKEDFHQAFAWYMKAANLGSRCGACNVARYYEHGRGVEQDLNKALEWYWKALNSGGKEIFALLLKLANQDQACPQLVVGTCYYQGLGVDQDFPQAAEWCTKAALKGNAAAQAHLATMYAQGEGFLQSNELAVNWAKKVLENRSATLEDLKNARQLLRLYAAPHISAAAASLLH